MEPRTNVYATISASMAEQISEQIDNEIMSYVNKEYMKSYNSASNPCVEVETERDYRPRISSNHRSFLHEILAGMGE